MRNTDIDRVNSSESENEISREEAFVEALDAAKTHLQSGRVQPAAKILNKVLTIDSNNIAALKLMAEVASLSKTPTAALQFLEKILSMIQQT